MSQQVFVVHPGTKTVLPIGECVIIRTVLPDLMIAGIKDGSVDAEHLGLSVVDPWYVLNFEPDEIREHFASLDAGEPGPEAQAVAAMTDDDLISVADRALIDDRLDEAFHEVLESAVQDFLEGLEEE